MPKFSQGKKWFFHQERIIFEETSNYVQITNVRDIYDFKDAQKLLRVLFCSKMKVSTIQSNVRDCASFSAPKMKVSTIQSNVKDVNLTYVQLLSFNDSPSLLLLLLLTFCIVNWWKYKWLSQSVMKKLLIDNDTSSFYFLFSKQIAEDKWKKSIKPNWYMVTLMAYG